MKGRYRVLINTSYTIDNKVVSYLFEVKRKITIVCGLSASGKTTLFDTIRRKFDSAVILRYLPDIGSYKNCDVSIQSLDASNVITSLNLNTNTIFILDEDVYYAIDAVLIAELLRKTNNYVIIISRESSMSIGNRVPMAVNEIYEIKHTTINNPKIMLYSLYKRFMYTQSNVYKYGSFDLNKLDSSCVVITEDSKSGFNFFSRVFTNNRVYTAKGKDKFCSILSGKGYAYDADDNPIAINNTMTVVLVIDGSAFGQCINNLMCILKEYRYKFYLFIPESFEFLLLSSLAKFDNKLSKFIDNVYEYLDCTKTDIINKPEDRQNWFGTWERYYYERLFEYTCSTYDKNFLIYNNGNTKFTPYSKSSDINYYLRYKDSVINLMEEYLLYVKDIRSNSKTSVFYNL